MSSTIYTENGVVTLLVGKAGKQQYNITITTPSLSLSMLQNISNNTANIYANAATNTAVNTLCTMIAEQPNIWSVELIDPSTGCGFYLSCGSYATTQP